MSAKLKKLSTIHSQDMAFAEERLTQMIERVRAGKVRCMALMWVDDEFMSHSSLCGGRRFEVIGLLETVKTGLIVERINGDE